MATPARSDGVVALRPWSAADADEIVSCLNGDEEGTGRVLGSVGLRWNDANDVAEVGYWLRADARGRGFATRALLLVTEVAFERGAARVQLRAAVENTASRRVAEKAGFTLEGMLRSAHWSPRLQRRVDWAMYALLPGDR
jgi:RimJ/RimL family protein N-acetyltransferase